MAPLPPGQPGLPVPGAVGGAGPPQRPPLNGDPGRRPRARRWALALALVGGPLLAALLLGASRSTPGSFRPALLTQALEVVPATVRALAAAAVLFGLCGFAVTRVLLPDGLRRHELLWILPTGAMTSALVLTLLGFAAVPFALSLPLVLLAGAAASVWAYRRHGLPARPTGAVGWPAYVAVLLIAVALIPFFRAGFPTVIGNGSDAHLAVGSAHFLQHHYPTSTAPEEPVDRVPLTWRSKHPIYYAFAGVARLSGLETWETIAPLAALLLAFAAVGLYLVARELLGAGVLAGVAAMGVAGLDRMVLHTGMHPYFNQTWGYAAFPFALVLSWWAVRHRSRGGLILLALFLAVIAAAYPLALPIPGLALVVAWWLERRARRRRGEEVASLSPRRFWRGPRSLVWMVPVAILLSVPALGVFEKCVSAFNAVFSGRSLRTWGGDLTGFVPGNQFFAIPFEPGAALIVWGLLAMCFVVLRRVERPLGWGLGAVLIFGVLFASYFQQRDYGWYFHFKVLAFVGPLVVAIAVVGLARIRRVGWALVALFAAGALVSATQELRETHYQLAEETIELREWADGLPAGASVRLDMWPPKQIWAGYFLAERPLCSREPLLGTDYPRVPRSRRADFVLAAAGRDRPVDAVGAPLRANGLYRLYRLRPGLPGPEACSRRQRWRVQQITLT